MAGLPNWEGECVVCIASGPSLTRRDVDHCFGRARIIVVNTSYQLCPWADILYSCDPEWWDWHEPEFRGVKVTQSKPAAIKHGCVHVPGGAGPGLSTDPNLIHWGGNSGFQAIGVAYHTGARRVLLLGYDMRKGPNGERHWHGNHPAGPLHKEMPLEKWWPHYDFLADQCEELGLTIINCSRDTALRKFPRVPIQEAL